MVQRCLSLPVSGDKVVNDLDILVLLQKNEETQPPPFLKRETQPPPFLKGDRGGFIKMPIQSTRLMIINTFDNIHRALARLFQ